MTDTPNELRKGVRPSDGDAQVRIVIPEDQSMVSLLGSGDELLRVVENAIGADFHVRGNEITVSGPAAEIGRASCRERV